MLMLRKEHLTQITAHARREYPKECCGALVGKKGIHKEVREVHPSRNVRSGAYEYELDPRELLEVFRHADEERLEVLGFYHSHPDIAPNPSQIDSSTAWSGFSYLIVSIFSAKRFQLKSWLWSEKKRRFEEEMVVVG